MTEVIQLSSTVTLRWKTKGFCDSCEVECAVLILSKCLVSGFIAFCLLFIYLICRMSFYLPHVSLQERWFGKWCEPDFRFSKVCSLHVCLKSLISWIEFIEFVPYFWFFSRLLAVNIYLKVKAINLQTVRHKELPDCYDFIINVSVIFHTYVSLR